MTKFLDIVENTMPPVSNESQNKMVDVLAELLDKIPSIEVVSTSKPEELKVNVSGSIITLHVADVTEGSDAEEDNEALTYNLDQNIERLATKAKSGIAGGLASLAGTPYQKAKAAVKRRENAAKSGIGVYERITDKLIKAIETSNKDLNTNINVI